MPAHYLTSRRLPFIEVFLVFLVTGCQSSERDYGPQLVSCSTRARHRDHQMGSSSGAPLQSPDRGDAELRKSPDWLQEHHSIPVAKRSPLEPKADYSPPTGEPGQERGLEDPAVDLSLDASNRYYLPGSKEPLFIMIRLRTPGIPSESYNGMSLALALDRSGSMGDMEKLPYLVHAAGIMVDQLGPRDSLAIITFNEEVDTLAPYLPVRNHEGLHRLLDGIEARGRTNLSGGLFEAYAELGTDRETKDTTAVLLITDGRANVGITDPEAILQAVETYASQGIRLSTIGVGGDFQERLLLDMANRGRGTFYFVGDLDEMTGVLLKELGRIRQVVAQNVRVTIAPPPGWEVADVYGLPFTSSSGEARVSLGDLSSHEGRTLLAELRSQSTAPISPTAVHVRTLLTYDAVRSASVRQQVNASVMVLATNDPDTVAQNINIDAARQVHLTETLRAIECALMSLERSEVSAAKQVIEDRLPRARELAIALKDPQLEEQAEFLDLLNASLSDHTDRNAPLIALPMLRKALLSHWYAACRSDESETCRSRMLMMNARRN